MDREAETKLIDILDLDRESLESDLSTRLGLEPFRARQLIPWIYKRGRTSFEDCTDIAKAARTSLANTYFVSRPRLEQVQQSKDGTRKYLFSLADGKRIESVLICQSGRGDKLPVRSEPSLMSNTELKTPERYTLCVSSQVGCAIGCRFCRTAQMGLSRNLSTGEIVGQVLAVRDDLEQLPAGHPARETGFQNIVYMGMGEPLHNEKNVTRSVRILNDELGLDFSGRKITVSTSGLVPAIERFGQSGVRANLAVSLNATTDDVRTQIMPINRKWPIGALLSALRRYPLGRGRRITIEYVMLGGINDSPEDLRRLPRLLDGIPVKVNLIPYNDNAGLGFSSPHPGRVQQWQRSLLDAGLNSTIRWSKGDDISAACGQLATEASAKTREREKRIA